MTALKCERRGCRSRNPRALWSVNGKKMCHSCFEKTIELQGMEQLCIVRLSDNDRDFPERLDVLTTQGA
jgi:hypothetical protein